MSVLSNITPTQKNEFKKLVDSMWAVVAPHCVPDPFREMTLVVGESTVCTLEFKGPVSVEVLDAVLAHVAFYKTLLPQDGRPTVTLEEVRAACLEAIDRAFMSAATETNP